MPHIHKPVDAGLSVSVKILICSAVFAQQDESADCSTTTAIS
jgi:hypothetical protein